MENGFQFSTIDKIRRKLIVSAIPFAVSISSCKPILGQSKSVIRRLTETVGSIPTIRHSDKVGQLEDNQASIIGRYYSFIGGQFDLTTELETSSYPLQSFLNLKSTLKPSYLFEYEDFLETVNLLSAELRDERKAFEFLFAHKVLLEKDKSSRLSHHRVFILWELANLLVFSGAFKAWGYKNYTGYMGGSFSDPNNPPYRPYP